MKKGYKGVVIALILAVVLTAGVSAQLSTDVSGMKTSFENFASDVAESLPYAATIGGSWSDAKVMSFPHFGAGLSIGFITIPETAFTSVADDLSISLPKEVEDAGLGVPFPGYTLDARLGLPMLPFDVGAKFGYMHPALGEAIESTSGAKADYLLAGVDIRYPVIKQKLLIPSVAVSAGINYLTGGVTMTPDATIGSIDVSSLTGTGGDAISFNDPDVRFNWKSTSLDFRVQASEKLLLFTFYGGGGYSYGFSSAGGGISADWTENTAYTKDEISQMLEVQGYDISNKEITILKQANGGSFHAFGGFSVDLLILRLDLQGKYNFMTNQLGAGFNARIQL